MLAFLHWRNLKKETSRHRGTPPPSEATTWRHDDSLAFQTASHAAPRRPTLDSSISWGAQFLGSSPSTTSTQPKNVTVDSVTEFQGQLQDLLKWTLSSVRIGRTPFPRLGMRERTLYAELPSQQRNWFKTDSMLFFRFDIGICLCVCFFDERIWTRRSLATKRARHPGKNINESQQTVSSRQQPQHANISGLHLTLTPLLISTSMSTCLGKKLTDGYSCGSKLQCDSLGNNPNKHGRHAEIDWGEGHPENFCGSRERSLHTVWVSLELIPSSSVVEVLRRVRSAHEMVNFSERRAPLRTCEKQWT